LVSIRLAVALFCAAACIRSAAGAGLTLIDAAKLNDFAAFQSLFAREQSPPKAASDLHDVWIYSTTDPAGSFFGGDRYNQLVSAHPAFAAYIEPFAVDDRRGNRFYPTAETKTFLIAEMAEAAPIPAEAERPATRRPAPREVAGRSTSTADALDSDMAKLGEFPAPPPRKIRRAVPIQMMDPTANPRGLFLIILALIAAGLIVTMLKTPDERTP
jgi:hypothetical protein